MAHFWPKMGHLFTKLWPLVDQAWAARWPILERGLNNTGQLFGQIWATLWPTLDHSLPKFGPLLDQSWHLFDVAHELVVEELVEHHDDNSAEVHFAREDN